MELSEIVFLQNGVGKTLENMVGEFLPLLSLTFTTLFVLYHECVTTT